VDHASILFHRQLSKLFLEELVCSWTGSERKIEELLHNIISSV